MPKRDTRRGSKATEATGVKPVITTIALDAETHRRLRHLAIDGGTSFRTLIRQAITEYLARLGRK